MVAIIDSPDFMFNDININNLSKSKKIYFFIKGILVGIIYKNFKGKLFCSLLNIFFPTKSKISFKDGNYYKSVFENKKIYYPNKRIVRVVNNYKFHFNFLFETYCLNEINFKQGDTIIDCGANVGELIFSFQQNNIAINYIAFEPEPNSFNSLTNNIKQFENSINHNIALSDTEGVVDFFIDSLGGNSSLEYFGNDEKVTIQTKSLDAYNFKNIKLLKLEAEGHEEEVLKGALKSLQHIEYISVDYGPEKGTNQESTISQVVKLLHENNFELLKSSRHRQIGLFKNQRL